jgi:hypothetical protein
MLHNNTIIYSWQTSEFQFAEKKKNWYWILGIIAFAIIIIAIMVSNYLLAVLIAIGTILIVKQSRQQPLDLDIEISEQGINIHDTMHTYESIRSFWIKEKKDGEVILILLTSQAITPLISVVIAPEIDPLEVRDYLAEIIPEEELRQSYTEQIIKKIGF